MQVTNRGGGEADGISIRGLPDITTTWNGRNVFTASGRALALQDIPANLVSRIDVFKTRAAEQLETGLAGQIDVRTRRPFDLPGFEMSVNARAIQQEQRDEIDPNVSLLVSNTWDVGSDGRFGALFNVSYAQTRYRDQSVTAGAWCRSQRHQSAARRSARRKTTARIRRRTIPTGFRSSASSTRTAAAPARPPPATPPLLWQAGLDRGLPRTPGSTLNIAARSNPICSRVTR